MSRTWSNRRRRAAMYASGDVRSAKRIGVANAGVNRSMLASMKSRPSRWKCSNAVSVYQSSPVDPCVKIEPDPSISTGRARSRSTDASAASNRSATPSGSGWVPSNRGTAKTRAGSPARIGSGNGSADGSPGTGPASSESNSRTSAIDVASGPNVERSIQSGMGSRPITPFVGLSPARPQNDGGDPDRTPAVRGGRDRRHARRDRGARAAARPAGRPVGPPRVRRGAVQRVRREPRERELRLVRLADHDRAGRAQPARHEPVGRCRRRVRERQRTERRRHARHGLHVLHQQGQSGERTGSSPAATRASIARASSSACSRTTDHGVERRVQALDPAQGQLDQLRRRCPAGADRRREVGEVHRCVTMSRMRTTLRLRFRSFSTTVDALRPGTPITPPPGCVPPPQR